jgi:PAS domain S-box-containing protein
MASERNFLPPAAAVALVSVFLDLRGYGPVLPAAAATAAVLLALRSTARWHAPLIAALCAAGLLVPPLIAIHRGLAALLPERALLALVVVGVALCVPLPRARAGAGQKRSDDAAGVESAELRLALARTARAEAMHREALDRLQMAAQIAGVSIWEWDLAANRLHCAVGSAFRMRLNGEQSIDGTEYFEKFVHPEDRATTQAVFRRAILAASGGDDRIATRYRFTLPDGGVRYIQVHARVLRDTAGRAVRVLAADRDVTEEVASARELERQAVELRDQERRLERASRSSLEGHWELDLLKKTRWHSSSFQALLGHEAREYYGPIEGAAEHTHPDDRVDAYSLHAATTASFDMVVRLRTADGNYRWFRMRGGAEHDASGQPIRVAGSAQDVHQQKLAEDALHEVQARFQRAVHGTQDGLWEIDLSGAVGRFWLSPRLHELLGFEAGELGEGQEVLRDRIHPDDVAVSDAAVRRQLEEGMPIDVEVRMLTKAGNYRWYRLRGSPSFSGSGRVTRTSGSMQDVTEARAAREALVSATEAAQAASGAKSAFLATMSHEIRTPMNGIIGMTSLLLDTVLGRVQREYAEAIRTSANSLLTIINDILDSSKIEAGKLEIEQLEMDLRAHVEEVGTMMALQAASKGLELVVAVDDEVPQAVRGDPQRIRQCLVNLVGNAIKFTAEGEIVIEVRVVGRRENTAIVRFEVRDTGMGIAPEARAELFQPFTQADSSITRRFGGTGLGLSIVKRLVELMGGEVSVQSEVGRGSTFSFTLALEAVEPSGRTAQLVLQGRGRRVLIVDDNETNRRVLAGQLELVGFATHSLASAYDALEQLRSAAAEDHPFDVVLIDYELPDMDGAALGERIAEDARLARTRPVLLTAVDRKGDQARFANMGFAAYLTKPVRARELRECLKHVLAHDAQEWSSGTHPLVTRGVLANESAQHQYSGRVLVVEDNPVNQKVAQRFLERLGCSVRVAADGAEAVAVTAAERFDLILMDMQMPVMDGVSATRAIRARDAGAARMPIVGLTANVLAGQFESCIAAGMDDVLSKPLEPARLKDVLERFILKSGAAAQAADTGQTGPDLAAPPLDLERLGSLVGDDAAFLGELITTFRVSSSTVLGELHAALGVCAREQLQRAAHKLKGASDNIGAARLCQLAARLESAAPIHAPRELEEYVAAIATELSELEGFFAGIDIATLLPRRAS